MLILTRRPGERVVIGEDVLVTVMEVSGQTVRLGIAAPQGLPIYREEIWLAVKEENRAAAEAAPDALPDGAGKPAAAEAAAPSGAQPGEAAQRPS
jgi:carbon storage regulator